MKLLSKLVGSLAATMVLGLTAAPASANFVISFYNNGPYISGGPGITTVDPNNHLYATATFEDTGANHVKLTMEVSNNLAVPQFVSKWFFSLKSGFQVSAANWIAGESDEFATTIDMTLNDSKADGVGGFFDLNFDFHGPNAANELDPGDKSVYDLVCNGCVATDFDALSTEGFLGAVHVQALENSGSIWMGGGPCVGDNCNTQCPPPTIPPDCRVPQNEIPEPGILALFGTGLLGLAIHRRRRHL